MLEFVNRAWKLSSSMIGGDDARMWASRRDMVVNSMAFRAMHLGVSSWICRSGPLSCKHNGSRVSSGDSINDTFLGNP